MHHHLNRFSHIPLFGAWRFIWDALDPSTMLLHCLMSPYLVPVWSPFYPLHPITEADTRRAIPSSIVRPALTVFFCLCIFTEIRFITASYHSTIIWHFFFAHHLFDTLLDIYDMNHHESSASLVIYATSSSPLLYLSIWIQYVFSLAFLQQDILWYDTRRYYHSRLASIVLAPLQKLLSQWPPISISTTCPTWR